MGGVSGGTVAPALQVIVLGSGGGPLESNVTALLIRSLSSGWSKSSVVAVDAGVHLSAIKRILKETSPPDLGQKHELPLPHTLTTGPFAGMELPHASAKANAAHIHRTLIDTYLITHAHLDHISGFVINTASLTGSRPKKLAGLPSTIAALKTHIFNNVIWPNLSDENNGAGLVTYMRLVEGGSPALGDGDGRGYLEISDGLAVKTFGVSHGHCMEKHSHRGSNGSHRYSGADGPTTASVMRCTSMSSPRPLIHPSSNPSLGSFLQHHQQERRRSLPGSSGPSGDSGIDRMSSIMPANGPHSTGESVCVYDSSAYFIRDMVTGREVLIFGDVEPDSISLSPRNALIWAEAAPKIAAGKLGAIFIECSYDDSQPDERLYGHLAPRFLAEEMAVLAIEVTAERAILVSSGQNSESSQSGGYSSGGDLKRKRKMEDACVRKKSNAMLQAAMAPPTNTSHPTVEDPISPKTVKSPAGDHARSNANMLDPPHLSAPTAISSWEAGTLLTETLPASTRLPLQGLKVVVIHVKDRMIDGISVGNTILAQLNQYEEEAQLGCEYIISKSGQDLYV